MGEIKRQGFADGPYEHLLQRLSVALDEAIEMEVVTEQPQMELELRGLTGSELRLIQAYLERDVEGLSGWLSAAREAEIDTPPDSVVRPELQLPLAQDQTESAQPPCEPLNLSLCCAICGKRCEWQRALGVQVCQGCGSQIFRAESHI